MARKRIIWRVLDALGESIFEAVFTLAGIFAFGAAHFALNWIFGVPWASMAVGALLTIAYYIGRANYPRPDQPPWWRNLQQQTRAPLEREDASESKPRLPAKQRARSR